MLSDPKALLGLTERRFVEAYIPVLEDTVRFRSMTAGDLIECQKAKTETDARLLPIILTVCNEHGSLIYTEDDLPALAKVDARVVDAMIDVINGFCTASETFDQLVARAAKNSETAPCDNSPTT